MGIPRRRDLFQCRDVRVGFSQGLSQTAHGGEPREVIYQLGGVEPGAQHPQTATGRHRTFFQNCPQASGVITIRVGKDHMTNTLAAVVLAKVIHDMRPVVLKASIDDVHEGNALAFIAQSDGIAALAFADAQEVDLEVGHRFPST